MSPRASCTEDEAAFRSEQRASGVSSKSQDGETLALDLLWRTLYAADGRLSACPSCGEVRPFHRVAKRRSYACDRCGKQIYPAAATPFARSPIPLSQWLQALCMILKSPGHLTAGHIAARLGISYRTAWSMRRRIERSLASDGMESQLLRNLGDSWSAGSSNAAKYAAERDGPESRICAAACRVMADRGLAETRIADIAAAAGLSSASIHYYFRSKDAMLLAAFSWACDQSNRSLERLLEERIEPVEHVRRLVDLCVPDERTWRDEILHWLEVWVRVRSHPDFLDECMRMSQVWYDGVREVFARGIKDGSFKPVAPLDEVCTRYVALTENLSYRVFVGYRDTSREEARRILARFAAEQLQIPVERLGA
jgi:AcrR family transcriptional regulator/transposase-like protein